MFVRKMAIVLTLISISLCRIAGQSTSSNTISIVDSSGAGTGSYNPDKEVITVCTTYANVLKIPAKSAQDFSLKGYVKCGKTKDSKFIFFGKPVKITGTGRNVYS